MKIDFLQIRFKFLVAGFLALFFTIGFFRYLALILIPLFFVGCASVENRKSTLRSHTTDSVRTFPYDSPGSAGWSRWAKSNPF